MPARVGLMVRVRADGAGASAVQVVQVRKCGAEVQVVQMWCFKVGASAGVSISQVPLGSAQLAGPAHSATLPLSGVLGLQARRVRPGNSRCNSRVGSPAHAFYGVGAVFLLFWPLSLLAAQAPAQDALELHLGPAQ